MRSVLSACLPCLLAGLGWSLPSEVAGQSLGELARESKEARKKRKEDGAPADTAKVFTESDLAGATGDGYSVMGAKPSEPKAISDAAEAVNERSLPANPARGDDHKDRREAWARRWQEQMDLAQQTLDEAEEDAGQCLAASRYFFVPIPIDCDAVPARVAQARERVEHLRRNRYSWDGSENP